MSQMLALAALLTLPLADVADAERAAPRPAMASWVFLVDRPPTTTLSAADTVLTDRALARRAARRFDGRIVDDRDRPVDEAAVAAVRAAGARVRATSRWLNAVSVEASATELAAIQGLPFVRSTQPVRSAKRDEPVESPAPQGGLADGDVNDVSKPQLAQLDLIALHEKGFTGKGTVIGVLDTGFQRSHVAFNDGDQPLVVLAEHDFINDDPNTAIEEGDPDGQHKHGTWILGTLAAREPGLFLGAAPDAAYVLAKTEDTAGETPIEEDYYVAGLEFVEANGADVATSSLGYINWYEPSDLDGVTAVTSVAVNIATLNGMVCVTSAGNGGHDNDPTTNHLGAPADAFDVITCGAVAGDGVIAGFSSDGPSADGRLKPEVLAWGVQTATVKSTADIGYTNVSGTSLSTPLIAGAIACVMQARPEFTVTAVRTALFTTASDYAFSNTPDPFFIRGYGIVQANAASLKVFAPADLTRDDKVNGADLGLLLSAWGPCDGCPADLDGNGAVDGGDLGAFLAGWTG